MIGIKEAMLRIIEGIVNGWLDVKSKEAIRFCTDSQSTFQGLVKGTTSQTMVKVAAIWKLLLALHCYMGCVINNIQFVLRHAGVDSNKQADVMAALRSKKQRAN